MGSGLPDYDFKSLPSKSTRLGKTDYNFDWNKSMFDSHDWADRKDGQPFFMQVQLNGGKMRGASAEANEAMAARAIEMFGAATRPEAWS